MNWEELENQYNIIGFCDYCKDPIVRGEPYVVFEKEGKKEMYHQFCWEQKNSLPDLDDIFEEGGEE